MINGYIIAENKALRTFSVVIIINKKMKKGERSMSKKVRTYLATILAVIMLASLLSACADNTACRCRLH